MVLKLKCQKFCNKEQENLPAVPKILDEPKKDSGHHDLRNIEQISRSIWFISLGLGAMSTTETVKKTKHRTNKIVWIIFKMNEHHRYKIYKENWPTPFPSSHLCLHNHRLPQLGSETCWNHGLCDSLFGNTPGRETYMEICYMSGTGRQQNLQSTPNHTMMHYHIAELKKIKIRRL